MKQPISQAANAGTSPALHGGKNTMIRADLARQDLANWEAEYQAAKYPETPYRWGLQKIAESTRITDELKLAVRWLFLWKLGKVSHKKTPATSMATDIDGTGYFASDTTGSNSAAIENAIDPKRIEKGLAFRDGALSFTTFSTVAEELTTRSLVLPAFYCHIWRPREFPIIDINVWESMRALAPNLTPKLKPNDWSDYFVYARFFTDLQKDFNIKARSLDKALWAWRGGTGTKGKTPCRPSCISM
jgi:hypothetical protein